jgi:hypothetical protein
MAERRRGGGLEWTTTRRGGRRGAAVDAMTREERERRGRRRPDSGGGEASARGKGEYRVVVSWVARLPNDGAIWPEDKFQVVGRSGEKRRIPGGLRAPKGALMWEEAPTGGIGDWDGTHGTGGEAAAERVRESRRRRSLAARVWNGSSPAVL